MKSRMSAWEKLSRWQGAIMTQLEIIRDRVYKLEQKHWESGNESIEVIHRVLASKVDKLEQDVAALKDQLGRFQERRPRYGADHTAIPRFAKERMAEIEEESDGA